VWYREAAAPKIEKAGKQENWVAGATMMAKASPGKALPLLLPKDDFAASDSFLQREAKFARRWLYSKGVMAPEEDRNPVEISLEDFFRCVRTGARPKADLEVGLMDSISVVLSNRAMEDGRRVYYNEV
jgi:predicted dehydrogenase